MFTLGTIVGFLVGCVVGAVGGFVFSFFFRSKNKESAAMGDSVVATINQIKK